MIDRLRADGDETVVEPSGWFAVQLRYAYQTGDPPRTTLVEDRVILVDGADEEAALGRAVELAPEYEEVVTGEAAARRLSDRACALAALSMTTSFAGGDLAGGIVTGIRMLAEAAGQPIQVR